MLSSSLLPSASALALQPLMLLPALPLLSCRSLAFPPLSLLLGRAFLLEVGTSPMPLMSGRARTRRFRPGTGLAFEATYLKSSAGPIQFPRTALGVS